MLEPMKATVDRELTINNGNHEFFKFVGSKIQSTLYKCVYPEDVKKLSDAIELLESALTYQLILRLFSVDLGYRWVTIDLKYNAGLSPSIDIEINDIYQLSAYIASIDSEMDVYHNLVSLADVFCYQYTFATGIFKIFWLNNSQEIVIYKGDIKAWYDECVENGYMLDQLAFDDFYADIRSGKKNFTAEFYSTYLTKGERKEFLRACSSTITHGIKKLMVVGTVCVVDPETGEKKDAEIIETARDPLTRLLNQRTIVQKAHEKIAQINKPKMALVVMDIDNFKYVNDTYGHMFGDEVLLIIANIMEYNIKGRGLVGRIGGDEFLLLIDNPEDDLDIRSILRAIRTSIFETYKAKFENFSLSCSMGVSVFPRDGESYEEIFKKADRAMYIAKERGKNRYVIYKEHLHGSLPINPESDILIGINRDLDATAYIAKLNEKISLLYKEGAGAISKVLEMLVVQYKLCLVRIYMKDSNSVEFSAGTLLEKAYSDKYFDNESYIACFSENNMFVVDHIDHLEMRFTNIYSHSRRLGVNRYVQGIIGDKNNIKGFITFAQGENKRNSVWSDNEYKEFSILTNIISNLLCDKMR